MTERASRTTRLLLILAGILAGLLLAEGVVRVSGTAPEVSLIREGRFRLSANPALGYEPVPRYEYRGPVTSFHDYSGKSNALGFRDVEHAAVKPPGTLRLVVLGDSVAAGQGVARLEDTFPRRLEAGLTTAGLAVEVVSLAVSGYDTGQEVAMLADRGLPLEPDRVILAYCLNDRGRSDGGILAALRQREQRAGGQVSARYHPVLVRSALYRLLRHRLGGPPEVGTERDGDSQPEAFAQLGRMADEHDFSVLVVIFPHFGQWGSYSEEWAREHQRVRELARSQSFEVLDLLPAFERCRERASEPLALDRFHPTAAGHACAARAVTEYLVRRGG